MTDVRKNENKDQQLAEAFKKYEDVSDSEERLNKVAEEVGAIADGNQYIKLDTGLMTVNQLDAFLKSIDQEFSFTNTENQFIYYNNRHEEEMMAPREAAQMGRSTTQNHKSSSHNHVQKIVDMMKSGELDELHASRGGGKEGQFVAHNYYAVREDDGTFLGVRGTVEDLQPMIDWYLEQTGQKLVEDEDAVSSATQKSNKE